MFLYIFVQQFPALWANKSFLGQKSLDVNKPDTKAQSCQFLNQGVCSYLHSGPIGHRLMKPGGASEARWSGTVETHENVSFLSLRSHPEACCHPSLMAGQNGAALLH